jgi:AraC-like DNA-binding protein
MRLNIAVVAVVAFLAVLTVPGAASAEPAGCLTFESPAAGTLFTSPTCTLAIDVKCANVVRVDLQASYVLADGDSATTTHLVSLSRPPYKYLWNISQLPNQLFTGISVTATATISGGNESHSTTQRGIFFAHNPIERRKISVPFALSGAKLNHDDASARAFDMHDPQVSARSLIVWNDGELIIDVNVRDPRFYSNRSGGDMAEIGLEALIDPERGKSPYPDSGVLHFVVPLSGTPYRIVYRAETDSEGWKLVQQTMPVDYAHNVGMGVFRGYSVRFAIPREAFGRAIPDTVSANLALRIFGDDNQIRKIPLHGGSDSELYSPLTWPYYYRLPKPLLMNAALQWTLFPILGFLTVLLAYIAILRLRVGTQFLSNFERSEEEERKFNQISAALGNELVKRGLKIDDIANRNGLTPQALNNLIKRCTGFSFVNYLQFCRTETAKRLLRSSRHSEKSIADQCGFANAIEMEQCFLKFHRMTPYKYRLKQ